jgi:hypothetical protein
MIIEAAAFMQLAARSGQDVPRPLPSIGECTNGDQSRVV